MKESKDWWKWVLLWGLKNSRNFNQQFYNGDYVAEGICLFEYVIFFSFFEVFILIVKKNILDNFD